MFVHKLIMLLIMLVSLILTYNIVEISIFTPTFNPFKFLVLLYVLAFSATFWVWAYVEAIDYIINRFGNESDILKEQALFVQKDLLVSLVSSVILVCVYWLDTSTYSFTSIDVGASAIPLLVSSLYATYQMFSIKILGEPLKKTVVLIFLLIIFTTLVFLLKSLINSTSNNYEALEAIWYQITFLCVSVVFFIQSHQQLFFLQKQEFGISKFKVNMSSFAGQHNKFLEDMPKIIEQQNRKLIKNKNILRK